MWWITPLFGRDTVTPPSGMTRTVLLIIRVLPPQRSSLTVRKPASCSTNRQCIPPQDDAWAAAVLAVVALALAAFALELADEA